MMLDKQQRTLEQQKFMNHMQKLEQQTSALREVFPDFDLETEMQNPVFARLTNPNIGMSVEDAFYAVHRKEIEAQTSRVVAQQTAQQISRAIQSGSRRPEEAGSSSQAPSVTTFDYRKMSRDDRKALKDEIRRAAAEGRKVYPRI